MPVSNLQIFVLICINFFTRKIALQALQQAPSVAKLSLDSESIKIWPKLLPLPADFHLKNGAKYSTHITANTVFP